MPSAAKARMALRTVCEAQPKRSAICGGPEALGAGQEDLAAAEGEGVGGAEAGPQGGPLLVGQGSDEEGWLHPADHDEPPPISQGHPWN